MNDPPGMTPEDARCIRAFGLDPWCCRIGWTCGALFVYASCEKEGMPLKKVPVSEWNPDAPKFVALPNPYAHLVFGPTPHELERRALNRTMTHPQGTSHVSAPRRHSAGAVRRPARSSRPSSSRSLASAGSSDDDPPGDQPGIAPNLGVFAPGEGLEIAQMSFGQLEALEQQLLAEADERGFGDSYFWALLDEIADAAADERLRRRTAEEAADLRLTMGES